MRGQESARAAVYWIPSPPSAVTRSQQLSPVAYSYRTGLFTLVLKHALVPYPKKPMTRSHWRIGGLKFEIPGLPDLLPCRCGSTGAAVDKMWIAGFCGTVIAKPADSQRGIQTRPLPH